MLTPELRIPQMLVAVVIVVFSLLPVQKQVVELGYSYINDGEQLVRHNNVMAGIAGKAGQYRVLPEFLLHPAIVVAQKISASQGVFVVFVSFRALINVAIFFAAYLYYKRLSCSTYASLIGLSLISRGMCFANFDSDLSFSTYIDVLIYLCAMLMIMGRRFYPALFMVLCAIGSLNRETSGFLPVILALALPLHIVEERKGSKPNGYLSAAIVGAVIWVAIFVLLRWWYHPQVTTNAYGRASFSWSMIEFNFGRMVTWRLILRTVNITPFLAVMLFNYWPPALKPLFFILVPVWLLVHAVGPVLAETRHIFVPFILVLFPATTAGIENWISRFPRAGVRKCPYCMEETQGKGKHCDYCGRRMAGPSPRAIGGIFVFVALLGWYWIFEVYYRNGIFDYVQSVAVLFCLVCGIFFIMLPKPSRKAEPPVSVNLRTIRVRP